MVQVQANEISIEVEEFGDPGDPPVLLIAGLGAQMTVWRDDFCRRLADRGHRVIRFDNRDVGLSTWFDDQPAGDLIAALFTVLEGDQVESAYSLGDMADDAVGVLDALGIDSAHVYGWSLGGMVAQHVAIRNPQRVRSLTSSQSMPRFIPMPTEVALTLVPPEADPEDRDTLVAAGVEAARICAGTLWPFDEDDARREIEDAIDRAWHPEGGIRQAVAALADDDRTPGLRNVRVPTLVLHGTADPLILPEGGQETAAAVPDAELVWIDGLGHEMPEAVWPLFLDPICALVARVEAA